MRRLFLLTGVLAIGVLAGCGPNIDNMVPQDVLLTGRSSATCGVVVMGDLKGNVPLKAADFRKALFKSLELHRVFSSVTDSPDEQYALTVSLRDYVARYRKDRLDSRWVLVRTSDGKTIWEAAMSETGSAFGPGAALEDAVKKTIKIVIEKISESLKTGDAS